MRNTEFLVDTEWFKLDKNSLYDRIINVYMATGLPTYKKDKEGVEYLAPYGEWKDIKTYYLRSDYMPIFAQKTSTSNTYEIQRVKYKPDITFKCTNYPNGANQTGIGFKLNIKNFYLFDEKGETLRNYSKLKIHHIIVQIGYWGNFVNVEHNSIGDLIFNFEDIENNKQKGITSFYIDSINSIYTQGMPPNASLEINGFCGVAYTGENATIMQGLKVGRNRTTLTYEKLYEMLTELFGKNWVDRKGKDKVSTLARKVQGFYDGTSLRSNVANAKMIVDDYTLSLARDVANQYSSSNELVKNLLEEITKETNGEPLRAMNLLNNTFGLNLRVSYDSDGNTLFYSESLDPEMIAKYNNYLLGQGFGNLTLVEIYKHKLPAVYNITYSAICEIQAPFFYFVDKFTPIDFRTNYWTTDSVYYYMDAESQENNFIAFASKIEFATTQDMNKITIECTQSKEKIK